MQRFAATWLLCVVSVGYAGAAPTNLVSNPSFEWDEDRDGVPDGWATSGHPDVEQQIVSDVGRDGKRSAKLGCTKFEGASGWHHVMICQVGVIGVRRGKWYRVSFWAKGEGRAAKAVSAALSKTKPWGSSGFSAAFAPKAGWKRFEFLFQATDNVPPAVSRLQFWFNQVGTLWLDDVEFVEVDFTPSWHPQIPAEGVRNLVPNSSFECGTAGWGGYTPKPGSWGANLQRVIGDLDTTAATHGRQSLKIHLAADRLPRLYFDYYEPIDNPIRVVLAANRGWFKVRKNQPYVLSASLRAARPGTVAVLGAVHAEGGFGNTKVKVDTEWRRYTYPFRPWREYVHIAVGLDLEASGTDEATLWIDAVQLEQRRTPTDYAPRRPVEAFISTPAIGNIFTEPAKGIDVRVTAFNDSKTAATLSGSVTVTDYLDRQVERKPVSLRVPPGAGEQALNGLAAGRQGFFRVTWRASGRDAQQQALRCALIEPFAGADSRLGMNHAYPKGFLLDLSRKAGILWWRDWSVKWQTVEPAQGAFDFSAPDVQIDRVRDAGGRALLLFPFPSALWASTADPKVVAQAAGGSTYLRDRMPTAFAAKHMPDFETYIRRSVRHYRDRITYYQVLNEPLYTTYALPKRFGYTMGDYLGHLKAVHDVARKEQPGCVIVGGIGCGPASPQAREFITAGGLRYVDVMDIHIYSAPGQLEWLEESLKGLQDLMIERKEVRPIWITEFGCYADDDPAKHPPQVGDQTMQRCARSSELEASADMVRLLSMFAAYGVEKVFFHAGTARAINQPSAGGVFFHYGGSPNKMYPTSAALARFLPPGSRFVKADGLGTGIKSYTFRTATGQCTVAWSADETKRRLKLSTGTSAFDLMGNRLAGEMVDITGVPVYLMSRRRY